MSAAQLLNDLANLMKLQEIDLEALASERAKIEIPEKIEKLRTDTATARGFAEEIVLKVEQLREEQQRLEKEVKTEQERIESSDSKLMSVKTNEEYQAVLKEMQSMRRANREREDRILEIMELIDGSSHEVNKAKQTIEEAEKQAKATESELQASLAEATKIYQDFEERRKEVRDTIKDKALVQRYDFLRNRLGNVVIEIDKEFCHSCQMALPPQVFNLVCRLEEAIQCPNCIRILYWDPNRTAATADESSDAPAAEVNGES